MNISPFQVFLLIIVKGQIAIWQLYLVDNTVTGELYFSAQISPKIKILLMLIKS